MTAEIIENKIIVKQGNSFNIPLVFDVDITGFKIHFLVKNKATNEFLINKVFTNHQDAVNGKTDLSFSASETNIIKGCHELEIILELPDGAVHTIFPHNSYNSGFFVVNESMAKDLIDV